MPLAMRSGPSVPSGCLSYPSLPRPPPCRQFLVEPRELLTAMATDWQCKHLLGASLSDALGRHKVLSHAMHARTHPRVHTPTHARAHARARTGAHACTHVRTFAHKHFRTYALLRALSRARPHARMHARTHARTDARFASVVLRPAVVPLGLV